MSESLGFSWERRVYGRRRVVGCGVIRLDALSQPDVDELPAERGGCCGRARSGRTNGQGETRPHRPRPRTPCAPSRRNRCPASGPAALELVAGPGPSVLIAPSSLLPTGHRLVHRRVPLRPQYPRWPLLLTPLRSSVPVPLAARRFLLTDLPNDILERISILQNRLFCERNLVFALKTI